MNLTKLSLIVLAFILFISSCSKNEDTDSSGQITSLEDQIATLKIQLEESEIKVAELKASQVSDSELESNKKLVTDFYQEVFGDLNIESINKYIGEEYIQHNPNLADGRQALIDGVTVWFQGATPTKIDVQRIVAEGDLVFLHTRLNQGRGVSVMDVFRIKDNLLVEHWDAIQSVPENSANPHPMF